MGTADELALDVLINLLIGYSTEVAGIRKLQMGGDNEAWPAPAPEAEFEGGQVPKVRSGRRRLGSSNWQG
jgi:hypothetical protein